MEQVLKAVLVVDFFLALPLQLTEKNEKSRNLVQHNKSEDEAQNIPWKMFCYIL